MNEEQNQLRENKLLSNTLVYSIYLGTVQLGILLKE